MKLSQEIVHQFIKMQKCEGLPCAESHRQLYAWLRELQTLKADESVKYCSFCQKNEFQVKYLLSGAKKKYRSDAVFICDECIMSQDKNFDKHEPCAGEDSEQAKDE
ncbi:hypothetical protein NFK14_05145 [Escherichia coli]|uniref:ClpX C4-type zinc finger protein n=1 Tax=Escherichia coli TaxID=562 RepID=UPI000BE819E3|nr:ClpX C4-type zinc finger protein [Escherichia coli]EFL5509015.1 hypothetical protein [Escherichia coli]EFN9634635.1 hypothetical protein [Escherichia coli]EFO4549586.1 hypothetical protein [Escherichia coli]EIE8753850.1 hypothetical protein [Escherichia coli]EIP8256577.1 hypothetical protein [Escherichia coli]